MSNGQDNYENPAFPDESFPHPSFGDTPPGPEGPLSAGARIGRFRIDGALGRGGMGIVYLARDMKLGRFVAIKSLPPDVRTNANVRARLQREATLLAQLNHPNIATIYDQFEGPDGITYLVLEYVPGQTLADRIIEGRLSLADALPIATQVAAALAAAHEHSIIHRDLKPSNIMITPQGRAKVLDFGLGKATDAKTVDHWADTKPGGVMGTLAYMSPEQAMGHPADYRTDIWSLGVVLYEMLAGHLPFGGITEQAITRSTLNDEPHSLQKWRHDIPLALDRLILTMLQKEPRDRYETMWNVVNELRSVKREALRATPEQAASLAVLPFADMSANQDRAYFCDGMAEELINALTQIKGLRVVARTSAFSYKGQNLNVRRIARELNVETVLEGSVRWAGDRLRVTAQLIDAERDHHVWSERYDCPVGDVFSIQDEITAAIVNRLRPTLLDQDTARAVSRRPADIEAYHLYLQGCYFRSKGTPGALQKGFAYLTQAIQRDPNYALAYAGLALSYSLLPFYTATSPKEAVPEARAMASKALALDETLAEAHGSLGFIKTWYDWDWVGAEHEIRRAIELNSGNDRLHLWYAYHHMLRGRHEEACQEIRRAVELDPVSIVLNRDLGMIFYFARQYDQAIGILERTIDMDPSIMYAHAHLGAAYMAKSMYREASLAFQKEKEIARGSHTWADTLDGIAHMRLGQSAETRRVLDRLLAQSKQNYVSPFHLACLHFELQEDDAGFEWLNAAYAGQDHWLCFLRTIPTYDRIGRDPRCVALVQKMDLGAPETRTGG